MAEGYRIGYPEETVAWKVMEFEYTELENGQLSRDGRGRLENYPGRVSPALR